jgi:endo-1,4-beta-xylanase
VISGRRGGAVRRRAFAAVLLAAIGCGGSDGVEGGLRDLAARAGLSIGSAAHDEHLADDPDYARVLAREFDSITPYTAMKWGRIHPEPDRYDFAAADAIVEFAEAHRMRVRGHTLVWGGAVDPPNPAYVTEASSPEELSELTADHIRTVMSRYRGRVDRWDVVNEPLTALGEAGTTDGLRDHVFLRQLGPGHIAEAFELAHAVDPEARLFVNDFVDLKPGEKQERYFRLVRDLLDANVRLHGVGFQGHLAFLPTAPPGDADLASEEEIAATLRRFAALGLDVEITELNVHTWRFEGDRAARLERQRELYASTVRACVAVPGCTAVTVWLFTDRYPTTAELLFRRDGEPLLFDDDYAPKPAYFGVRDALLGGP